MTEIYLIDTETTGLRGYPCDHVVDVGICSVNPESGKIDDVYSSIVGHDVSLWDDAHRNAWIFSNTDLTLEAVSAAPPADEVAKEISKILSCEFVTSYNVGFDFDRFLVHPPYNIKSCVSKVCPDPMLIAMNICRIPGPYGNKWPRLEEAYAVLCPDDPARIGGVQDHRALSDARVASHVLVELYRRGFYRMGD
ncbi:MAG: 3'-5' exonuclease [Candidatus Methanoplasma sp.]|nr:3'-5' exonuclease [Candidatus Methanoplasma sp.]